MSAITKANSMRQFLCELGKRTSAGMTFTADGSRDKVDSTTNGSCSTQKVTTEGSSEAHQRSLETVSKDIDVVSPDSQSFASKCVATQGENMHPPPSIRHVGLITTQMFDYGQFASDPVTTPNKDIPLGTSALAGAIDIKLDIRNHSSSASEERLPKVLLAGNCHNGLPQVVGNIAEKHEKGNEAGAEKPLDESSSRKTMPVDREKQLDAHLNRVLLTEFGKVTSSAGKVASSQIELTQEVAQVEFRGHSNSNLLTSNPRDCAVAELSAGQGLFKPVEMDQMHKTHGHDFQSAAPDLRCLSRKRRAECASFSGGNLGETLDLAARKSKRIMVQASLETTNVTTHASMDSFMTKLMHLKQGSSSNGSEDKAAQGQRINMMADTKLEGSFIPCSCEQQKIDSINTFSATDSKLSTQGRCKECGCFLAPSLIHQINQTASEQAPTEAGHVTESPIPATQ